MILLFILFTVYYINVSGLKPTLCQGLGKSMFCGVSQLGCMYVGMMALRDIGCRDYVVHPFAVSNYEALSFHFCGKWRPI